MTSPVHIPDPANRTAVHTNTVTVLRFVPQGSTSLLDDAPGWEDDDGPTCWKCKGVGKVKPKKQNNEKEILPPRPCPICHGQGCLLKRKASLAPGKITRGRMRPPSDPWPGTNMGPEPAAITSKDQWSEWILKANKQNVDVLVEDRDVHTGPSWLPRIGEELCNLVGNWRILQRVGSHRWTTDDLVTAWVASAQPFSSNNPLKYLDLGTGNGSVLQMVTWALCRDGYWVHATGVEARSEAVDLARRSLSFNIPRNHAFPSPLSTTDPPVAEILHADFRDAKLEPNYFQLVTGTPPYFRVDFTIDPANQTVSHAKIRQGGMPTSKQSAPARCEFRGGIEAYCDVAARVLRPDSGRFVVCENWLNHHRVIVAANNHGLRILEQVQVSGREGKNTLFCVYVMKRWDTESQTNSNAREESPIIVRKLAVRTQDGDWTQNYKALVLSKMSIPCLNL